MEARHVVVHAPLDVEEGVGVFNGDGSEQPWWELCPIEATLVAGEYFKATLSELGYDVPTDGVTAYSVMAKGLPAGLKLKYNAAVTKKVKKGKTTKKVVVKPAKVEWWIEGVPTAALDYATNPPYLVITANGKTETLPLSLGAEAQEVTPLGDLALGESLNKQFYLPGVTNGWTVSGLPTGLKYTAKLLTTSKKVGKKTVVTTNALPYSVYGKTTKAGLFTITAKQKVGAFYETMKYRVLVKPAPVDTALFGEGHQPLGKRFDDVGGQQRFAVQNMVCEVLQNAVVTELDGIDFDLCNGHRRLCKALLACEAELTLRNL